MIGCGSSGESEKKSSAEQNATVYSVSFYDANLDFNGSTDVTSNAIDIAELKTTLDINASALYAASSDTDVLGETAYSITGDIRLYAEANVTEITDQNGLAAINADAVTLNGKYILLNDIALDESGAGFEGALGWKPIGDETIHFNGIFNGDNHKITSLWIDRQAIDCVGLFGYIDVAQIRNIGVEIAEGKAVTGGEFVGAIAGWSDGLIVNSYSTGNVSGNHAIGGIAGGSGGLIANSYATGNVSGNSSVGGIAGSDNGSITYSYATGNVSAVGSYVGGIAGMAGGFIINSYATGNVSGDSDVGGIGGAVAHRIINSYATGNVSGTFCCVGGIAGILGGDVINSYAEGNVSGYSLVGGIGGRVRAYALIANSYATGNVSGDIGVGGIAGNVESHPTLQNNAAINSQVSGNSHVDRIVGLIEGGDTTVSNNFTLSSMSITAVGAGNNGTSKTIGDLKTRLTYESAINGDGLGGLGWFFGDDDDHPWKIDASKNNGLPYLYWEN
ncbi:MAG: hypothetical protein LBO72_08935 [Helicobacteraceae bacterium]|nr:hypothetical protein [Helicobacteraceae bacterium]